MGVGDKIIDGIDAIKFHPRSEYMKLVYFHPILICSTTKSILMSYN